MDYNCLSHSGAEKFKRMQYIWCVIWYPSFVSYQLVHPSLKYDHFSLWPLNSKNSLSSHCRGQSSRSHSGSNTVSVSHPFHSMSIGPPIPNIWLFEIWPWKSKFKIMGEVKDQGHKVDPASYRLTSPLFHVNRPSPLLRYVDRPSYFFDTFFFIN